MTAADRADILEFWHTVEMFSPQPVEKVSRERRVFAARAGRPLPWEPGHELADITLRPNQAWRHVVYLGVYGLAQTYDVLRRVFEPDGASYEERPQGTSALAAFLVSADGRPMVGSEVLSSCAWATGRALHPGPSTRRWLQGFGERAQEFSTAFEDLVADDSGDQSAEVRQQQGVQVGRPIGLSDLQDCLELAADLTGTTTALPTTEIRIRSEIVAARTALEPDGHDFLNSFIAEDLARVAGHVRNGSVGSALRAYLRPGAELDADGRIDVRAQLDQVYEAIGPDNVPLGRWPADTSQPLAAAQQLAVNLVLGRSKQDTPVLGVNGPPGTGKTTMLRDLIAGVVVERACRLALLDQPSDAFVGVRRWKTGERTRVVHLWRPELTGFEMVLTSANNGAVENVTTEIPASTAIDPSWQQRTAQLNYFPETASALLGTTSEGHPVSEGESGPGAQAWGLAAARLGNKKNRSAFVDTFWWRKPEATVSADSSTAIPAGSDPGGLRSILIAWEKDPPARSWQLDVEDFNRALAAERRVRAERERSFAAVAGLAQVTRSLRETEARLTRWEDQLDQAQQSWALADLQAAAAHAERSRCEADEAQHRQDRPRLLKRMATLGRATRRWGQDHRPKAEAARRARLQAEAADELVDRRRAETEGAARQVELVRQDAATLRAEQLRLSGTCQDAAARLGSQFPDPAWWTDRERRETSALWTDASWNRARTDLYLAALRLHKAFIRHTPTQLRQSLQGAMDIVGGQAPEDLAEESALAAWRSLFFLVPVVSTTFASYARLFFHLKTEALGWLLIDEAGQATPQQAVGALWRSQRAVVVGDPLQLEPITTVPFRAEQAIRIDHGVAEEWLTSRTSVQRLADRLTRFGTRLTEDEGEIWVGAPLAVHRRCDQPMFGIANRIAYGDTMINKTSPKNAAEFDREFPTLPPSKWIDVDSSGAQGHWIPAEGAVLGGVLDQLSKLSFDLSRVMVIAPFRDTARRIETYQQTYPGLVAGTIHTAQGKEADIVILILGSDPQREGARRWAAGKPNLLNVAVSRARRRLYVIGNHRLWSTQRHFDVLAARLPRDVPRVG